MCPLIYFIQHNTFKIYTHYHAWQDFIFLWLSSIPLHVCVHKCVCVCVCVYEREREIFIHSSINGHLGCSRILAIANNTSTNMGMQVSF